MALYIPEDVIETVRNASDILEIVSEGVQLKKSGQHFMGLCPFHSEKTPSFSVNPSRGIFHCFGCGVGGNVFSYIMKRDGIPFPESVRVLAAKYGISMPEKEMSPAARREENEKESLYSVNKEAMGFFKSILFHSEQGKIARDYLKQRGMTASIAEEFNLGYVPEGWDHLARFLAGKKIPRKLVEKSGLIASKNGERFYDRFRNRIIFPICDMSQRVIGFGGRVLDQSLPKYLNSPETAVYNKSRSLYGLHRTRQALRETETVHIVEGYFDLLALYMHGIKNVVATLGTALTREHVRMLSRCGVTKFVLVFDSDDAGVQAASRSIPVFQKEYVNADILVLPKPHDPDSYIRAFGPDHFRTESDKALGIVPFLAESAIKKHGLSIEGRLAVINDMKPVLGMVEDSVARSLYIRDLAHKIGVDERAVLEKVQEHIPEAGERNQDKPQGIKASVPVFTSRFGEMERQIVSMMIQYPQMIEECRNHGVVDYMENPCFKAIGRMIMEYRGDVNSMAAVLTTRAMDEETRRTISGLAIGDIPYLQKNCVNLIHQYMTNRKKTDNTLSQRIRLAEERNDHELLVKLIHEKNMLSKTMNKHGLSQKKIINSGIGGGKSI